MKSNKKNIIVLLVLVMGFVFLPNIKLDFGDGQKTNVINPKISAEESFIHIDGSIPNNWSYTVDNYTWCSGDGSWGNPYTIENVTVDCGGIGSGIFIDNSKNDYFIIRNCTVFNSGVTAYDAGIKLEDTCNGTLFNNNCSNNGRAGILLYDNCNNNTISGNTAINNFFGIYLYECDYNTVSGNIANDNDYGIYIEISNDNTISGNTANENSLDGIYSYLGDYNNITGNTANNNDFNGIYLDDNCDNNTISGNTANDNAIRLKNSDYNNITGNIVNDHTGDPGIYLFYSDHNTVSGNTANNNGEGIYIQYSNYNNVTGNTANNNSNYGIYFYESKNNIVSGNTASLNGHGIFIEELCDYNEITENIINNNTIGLEIDTDCNNTLVFKNFFLNNGIHAVDDGTDNKWNSTTIGNYWDNWTSPDTDPLDGIVDDPYTFIGGSTGGTDYLPIAEDGVPSITINSPSEDDVFGTSAPSFSVTITDTTLDEMWYTLDGGLHNYTFTANGTIDQSAWDALSDGTITLTFYASDIPGNIGSADVIITKGIPSDGLDPTIVIVIVVVSVVGGVAVLAVVYIFMKKRATP